AVGIELDRGHRHADLRPDEDGLRVPVVAPGRGPRPRTIADMLPPVRPLAWIVGIGAMTAACIPLQDLSAIGPGIKPPSITFTGATLVSTPSRQQLAAYYCPDLVNVPLGGAALLCQGLFGPRPSPEAMAIAFDARLKIQNPNEIPLPLATLLAAI